MAARAPGARRGRRLADGAAARRSRAAWCRPSRSRCAGRRTAGVRPHAARGAAAERPSRASPSWLAEVAQTALDIVLIVDEAEHLPAESREAARVPAAQRAAQPARAWSRRARTADLGIDDLIEYGQCVPVGASLLRFELDETIALVQEPPRGRLRRRHGRPPARADRGLAARPAARAGGDGRAAAIRAPRWRPWPAAAACCASSSRRLAAGQPRPGRSRVPDPRRDRSTRCTPICAGRSPMRRTRRSGWRDWPRHADLRHRRGAASGCACTP